MLIPIKALSVLTYFHPQLRVTSLGVQGRGKWMKMPNIGNHIASRYIVILVSLFMNLNLTFFPLVVFISMTTSKHKFIAVGFINTSH